MGRKKRNRKRARKKKNRLSPFYNCFFKKISTRRDDFDSKVNYNQTKKEEKMKIGIIGWSVGERSFGVGKNYIEFCRRIPHMITENPKEEADVIMINPWTSESHHEEIKESLDLLILPGGADLSPHFYGESPSPFTGYPDTFKEAFFARYLKDYINAGVPVFGICLGFQMINVHFGGKLIQHIMSGIHQETIRWKESHDIFYFQGDEKLRTMKVNSHHHQGVKPEMIGRGLTATAYSDELSSEMKNISLRNLVSSGRGLIEGFIHRDLPVAGVQWHPEEFYDDHTFYLIKRITEDRMSKKQIKKIIRDGKTS